QLLAGIGEFFVGNTFGATALSSYGGFWLSYAAILVPSFNSAAPYTAAAANGSGSATEFKTAVSFFLFGWFIFTFLMLVAVLRHSIAFIFLFTTLDMAFLMLALGEYLAKEALIKAGGVFGLLAAFAAWYCAMAQMLTQDNSFFTIPVSRESRVESSPSLPFRFCFFPPFVNRLTPRRLVLQTVSLQKKAI
ncbi:hypothetical protein FRC18_011635, partial [Serendipita sp. 400]